MSASELAGRYAAIYRERERERRAGLGERATALRALLPQAAELLKTEFGATRVGVFGSLLTTRFDDASDVDLYADTIADGRFFEAVDRVSTLLGVPVDLIELRTAPASLLQRIAEDGLDVD